MATKTKDLVVKTGTYVDRYGEEKARWRNVGALMVSDEGHEFLLLDRSFNPAGIVGSDERESILVNLFDPSQGEQERPSAKPASRPSDDFDDDIPF